MHLRRGLAPIEKITPSPKVSEEEANTEPAGLGTTC